MVSDIFINYFSTILNMSILQWRIWLKLVQPFTKEEVESAIKGFHQTKAPGPNGFPYLFYQQYWPIVGDQAITDCLDILNNAKSIKEWNHTNLVLIPKVKDVRLVIDYRPISLCNVAYKIVTKVIANRLKIVLNYIIDECQSTFIPGRSICDNFILGHENLH